jgi:hypothetical protein
MSNNKNVKKDESKNTTPVDELQQLRTIVFGNAEQQLKEKISSIHAEMQRALNLQNESFNAHLSNFQQVTEQRFTELEQRLSRSNKTHEDNESVIQKDLANLASEHEMFATSTQQDFKSIEQSLNSESDSLNQSFNEQIEQLKSHLEGVSKELSSSKTDRKTLAKLLSTMATNLEDDQL